MRPIPIRELPHSVTLRVASSVDAWQSAAETTYSLSRVRMQTAKTTEHSRDDTSAKLGTMLFYDCASSRPALDLSALLREAEAAGGCMYVDFMEESFRVRGIDALYDGARAHHYEVKLE